MDNNANSMIENMVMYNIRKTLEYIINVLVPIFSKYVEHIEGNIFEINGHKDVEHLLNDKVKNISGIVMSDTMYWI